MDLLLHIGVCPRGGRTRFEMRGAATSRGVVRDQAHIRAISTITSKNRKYRHPVEWIHRALVIIPNGASTSIVQKGLLVGSLSDSTVYHTHG